jgi:hypothetical protein
VLAADLITAQPQHVAQYPAAGEGVRQMQPVDFAQAPSPPAEWAAPGSRPQAREIRSNWAWRKIASACAGSIIALRSHAIERAG